MTFTELCERLMQVDEISLLEVLEISSEDLVERFHDKIDMKRDWLEEDLEEAKDEY